MNKNSGCKGYVWYFIIFILHLIIFIIIVNNSLNWSRNTPDTFFLQIWKRYFFAAWGNLNTFYTFFNNSECILWLHLNSSVCFFTIWFIGIIGYLNTLVCFWYAAAWHLINILTYLVEKNICGSVEDANLKFHIWSWGKS